MTKLSRANDAALLSARNAEQAERSGNAWTDICRTLGGLLAVVGWFAVEIDWLGGVDEWPGYVLRGGWIVVALALCV